MNNNFARTCSAKSIVEKDKDKCQNRKLDSFANCPSLLEMEIEKFNVSYYSKSAVYGCRCKFFKKKDVLSKDFINAVHDKLSPIEPEPQLTIPDMNSTSILDK